MKSSFPASIGEAFDGLRSDYNAAKNSRYRRRRSGVNGVGRNADYHYRTEHDYLRMMELSRDFDRNDCVVPQGLKRLIDNVLQDGLTPDPDTGDENANEALKRRWKQWACSPDACDSTGERTFHQLERLVLRHSVVDGDICALPLRSGQIELVEAHRLRTPSNTKLNVVHGIKLDQQRRRLEYWFTRDNLSPTAPLSKVSEVIKYPARDADGYKQVWHVYRPERASQTRGVTAFAPIADMIGMHDDVQFAQLVRQQVSSCFAILRQRELGFSGPANSQRGEQETTTLSDGSSRLLEGVAPGMEINGAPGEKLTGFSAAIPNNEFFKHAHLILTIIAINLGLPVAVLLLDPSETNFSGWRGAMDQARQGFRELQNWLIEAFHTPVYQYKVRQWLSEDQELRAWAAQAGVDIFNHRWNRPRFPYLEPNKDAAADLVRWRSMLTSPRRLHAERSQDFDEIVRETVEDNVRAIRTAKLAAKDLNSDPELQDGNPVHWRELLSLPLPEGMTVAVGGSDSSQSEQPDQGRKQPEQPPQREAA